MNQYQTDKQYALSATVEEKRQRKICVECIEEQSLKDIVEQKSTATGKCFYCGHTWPLIKLETLADKVKAAFQGHYRRHGELVDYASRSMLVDSIFEETKTSRNISSDIQSILEKKHRSIPSSDGIPRAEFNDECPYSKKDSEFWQRD